MSENQRIFLFIIINVWIGGAIYLGGFMRGQYLLKEPLPMVLLDVLDNGFKNKPFVMRVITLVFLALWPLSLIWCDYKKEELNDFFSKPKPILPDSVDWVTKFESCVNYQIELEDALTDLYACLHDWEGNNAKLVFPVHPSICDRVERLVGKPGG